MVIKILFRTSKTLLRLENIQVKTQLTGEDMSKNKKDEKRLIQKQPKILSQFINKFVNALVSKKLEFFKTIA